MRRLAQKVFFFYLISKSDFFAFFRILGAILGVFWRPKSMKKSIVTTFFPMPFFDVFFLLIFYRFSKAANLDFIAPVEAKHYFLRNRRFRKRVKKSMKFQAFLEPKSSKNQSKRVSETTTFLDVVFFIAFFAYFGDFGSIC